MEDLKEKLENIIDAIIEVEDHYSKQPKYQQLPSDLKRALTFVRSEIASLDE